MTETEQLIRQAAYELQISPLIIEASLENIATYTVAFKRNNGDETKVTIVMDQPFLSIHDTLKYAYKGKPQPEGKPNEGQ